MKVNMVTVYEGQEVVYDMPVGDGRMTVKWLGLAAAQRFAATVKPRGYRRHREKAGPSKILCTSAKLLPCRVYTAQSTFLHPEKSIREELRDGETVFVLLTNKMPVNHIGRPLRERWMFIAFCVSEQTEQERTRAIDSEYIHVGETRVLSQNTLSSSSKLAAKKGAVMRRMMVSQLYCPDKVERAFDRDWTKLCHPVMQPIDKITEDLEEQSRVKEVVLANYVTLVEVFKHYASVGSAVATGEIDIMEFSAFMHDLRGFSASKSRDLVEKAFGEAVGACRGEKGRQAATGAMGMIEFLYCILRLSCIRHHVSSSGTSVGGGGASAAGESGGGSSKIRWAGSAHEAVEMFMEGVVLPLAHRKVIGLQIKTALDSDEILAVYHDHDAGLRSVFDKYCKANDRAGAPAALGVLLNIAEFRMILKDSGLLGGNNKEDDELTTKEARQAFAGAQNDLCGGDSYGATASSPDLGPQIEQMTYPEFLEGIARVAMLKWEDAASSPKGKIERAIGVVTSLLD
ncbi:unnamed protein product, partial [Scytosiphon promiscuus]